MAGALALVAACAPGVKDPAEGPRAPVRPEAPQAPAPVVSPVPTPYQETFVLYLPHRDGIHLVRAVRQVTRRGEQPQWLAIQLLTQEPAPPEARPLRIPTGMAGLGSRDPALLPPKGTEGHVQILLRQPAASWAATWTLADVYAVVNTLAIFPGVQAVQFAAEGHHGPLLVGGVDITRPLAPRWDLVVRPDAGPALP